MHFSKPVPKSSNRIYHIKEHRNLFGYTEILIKKTAAKTATSHNCLAETMLLARPFCRVKDVGMGVVHVWCFGGFALVFG